VRSCGVCFQHRDSLQRQHYEISRGPLWILRHHPDPAPLVGWLLLDARRHLGGAMDFTAEEAIAWGPAVQQASHLVQEVTGCARVYAIAFGEGAQHLHLHLIPRFAGDQASSAWNVADLYRTMAADPRAAASPEAVRCCVKQCQNRWSSSGWSL